MRGRNILVLLLAFAISLTVVSTIELNDFSCQSIVQYKNLAINQTLPEKALFTDEIINIYLLEFTKINY